MHIVLFHFYSKKPNPVYQEMARAMRRMGHRVTIAEPDGHGDLAWRDADTTQTTTRGPRPLPTHLARLPIFSKLLMRWRYTRFLTRVREHLGWLKPDIVQVNPPPMAWLLPLLMPARTSFVLDIRQINEAVRPSLRARVSERFTIWGMRMNAKLFYKKTCFCHEEAAKRVLGEQWGQRGVVVPVGVDDRFNSFLYEPAVCPKTAVDPVKFIYIGTLSRLRNLERLLEAASLLKQKTDRFQLDLVGPDTSEGHYPGVLERLELESVAAIKPPVPYEQVPELLASYDVGLAYVPNRPTWHYQPTIKVLEYRALGLPILSTDVASHREVVQQNVNGILCGDSPEQIADAMYEFIKDETFLNTVTEKSRRMRRGKSWSHVAEMYINSVYQPLLGRS